MPVCGNYLFFELPKKIVLNPKDGDLIRAHHITDLKTLCEKADIGNKCGACREMLDELLQMEMQG